MGKARTREPSPPCADAGLSAPLTRPPAPDRPDRSDLTAWWQDDRTLHRFASQLLAAALTGLRPGLPPGLAGGRPGAGRRRAADAH